MEKPRSAVIDGNRSDAGAECTTDAAASYRTGHGIAAGFPWRWGEAYGSGK